MKNFYDGRFHNLNNSKKPPGFLSVMKWMFNRNKIKWPEHIPNQFFDVPPPIIEGTDIRISFIGHATFLVQTESKNILTDPVFSERASFVSFLGPKRVSKPGVAIDLLPKIDIVLVSHNHYDHLDIHSLKFLAEKDNPLIILPKGNESLMKSISNNVVFLDWGESYDNIYFEPSQHWSARGLFDKNKSLWGTFIMKFKNGDFCFIGDTGYDDNLFKVVGEKYPSIRLAIIPIGAYEPRWFMKDIHINPEEAVKIHLDLKANLSIASHFATFPLADESYDQPIIDLSLAMNKLGVEGANFIAMEIGKSIII